MERGKQDRETQEHRPPTRRAGREGERKGQRTAAIGHHLRLDAGLADELRAGVVPGLAAQTHMPSVPRVWPMRQGEYPRFRRVYARV
jgi:hypothetical protein